MTHTLQIQNTHPAQASSKASVEARNLKSFRIEASATNPETRTGYERGNLHDYYVVREPAKACEHARNFWRRGYWVEVYDDATNELLAGPIDPDTALPSYII